MVEDGDLWLKGTVKNVETGICPVSRREEELSRTLRCDGKKMWKENLCVSDFGISIQKYEL